MTRSLLALTLLLTACGDGGTGGDDADGGDTDPALEVVGLYQITSDQESDDCGPLQDAVIPLPYYRVVAVTGGIEVRVCRTPDDCDDFSEYGVLSTQDNNFKALVTWAYWQADSDACIFDARRTTLKQKAGDTIEVESVQVETFGEPAGKGTPDDAACEAALEDWTPTFQSDTLACWKRTAVRVE